MSTFVDLKSACGKKTASVDILDLEENAQGIICCAECVSIITKREGVIK